METRRQDPSLSLIEDRVREMDRSQSGWIERLWVVTYPFQIVRSKEDAETIAKANFSRVYQLRLTPKDVQ
jgi:hypothetical protein